MKLEKRVGRREGRGRKWGKHGRRKGGTEKKMEESK
jgi:hypothetical protein